MYTLARLTFSNFVPAPVLCVKKKKEEKNEKYKKKGEKGGGEKLKRREKARVSVDDYVAAIIPCPWRRPSPSPRLRNLPR